MSCQNQSGVSSECLMSGFKIYYLAWSIVYILISFAENST